MRLAPFTALYLTLLHGAFSAATAGSSGAAPPSYEGGASTCAELSDAAPSCSTDATVVANVVGAVRASGSSGGQTVIGGTSTGESLTLRPNSTADRNNGFVCFGRNGVSTTGFPCINPREENGEGMAEFRDGTGSGFGYIRVTGWYTGSSDSSMHRDRGLSLRGSFPINWYGTDLGSSPAVGIGYDSGGTVKITDGSSGQGHIRAAKSINYAQVLTIADNATPASRATDTLTPATSYVKCDCGDADGCDLTLSETGAVDGQTHTIVNISANACGLADTSGVSELSGAIDLGQWDSITLLYVTDRYVQTGRSDN